MLREDELLEYAPGSVRREVLPAAERAVAAGADAETLEYVGAGQQGIVFADADGRAYKVARNARSFESLALEAEVLDAISKTSARGYAPRLIGFDDEHGVLVREHIEGRPGGWSAGRETRAVYELIAEALDGQDFTAPEYKEDSFVRRESDGRYILVDAGFAQPKRARVVTHLRREIIELDPGDEMGLVSTQFEILQTWREGALSLGEAREMFDQLEAIFGERKVAPHRREFEYSVGVEAPPRAINGLAGLQRLFGYDDDR